MTPYRFTSKAEEDLFEIWYYISRDSVEAANRVEAAIYDACAFLFQAPLRGHVRKDLTNLPVRFWTVLRYPNYVIVYDSAVKPLEILRLFHGRRDISRQLKDSE